MSRKEQREEPPHWVVTIFAEARKPRPTSRKKPQVSMRVCPHLLVDKGHLCNKCKIPKRRFEIGHLNYDESATNKLTHATTSLPLYMIPDLKDDAKMRYQKDRQLTATAISMQQSHICCVWECTDKKVVAQEAIDEVNQATNSLVQEFLIKGVAANSERIDKVEDRQGKVEERQDKVEDRQDKQQNDLDTQRQTLSFVLNLVCPNGAGAANATSSTNASACSSTNSTAGGASTTSTKPTLIPSTPLSGIKRPAATHTPDATISSPNKVAKIDDRPALSIGQAIATPMLARVSTKEALTKEARKAAHDQKRSLQIYIKDHSINQSKYKANVHFMPNHRILTFLNSLNRITGFRT